jgi:hypothetical protein
VYTDQSKRIAGFLVAYFKAEVRIGKVVRRSLDAIDSFEKRSGWLNEAGQPRVPISGDSFFCRPVIDLVLSDPPNAYASPQAKEVARQYREGTFDARANIICEHVVPINVLESIMRNAYEANELNSDFVLELYSSAFRRAFVTREQDLLLRRQSMPEDWDFRTHNPFARYHQIEDFAWSNEWH